MLRVKIEETTCTLFIYLFIYIYIYTHTHTQREDVSKRALQLYSKCYCVAFKVSNNAVCTSLSVNVFCNTNHTVTFGIPLYSSF
jgi:hypothetical protein